MTLAAPVLAFAVDVLLGEPPSKLHPVVWMGGVLDCLQRRAPRGRWARLMYGSGVALLTPLAWGAVGWAVEWLMPWPVQAMALKSAFAGRSLLASGERVEHALRVGDDERARLDLRWLVSRPTAELDAGLVAAAAIESLAENSVDAWVAPLLAYACFGLGGAYAYRAANTADAMWGYRTPELEWLGKAAARLDDALNWVPARIGAALLVVVGSGWRDAATVWRRDAALTASPNAGQPMAAMAGQLGVRLEKRGHYVLNAAAQPPSVDQLAAARRLTRRAMLVSAALMLGLRLVASRLLRTRR